MRMILYHTFYHIFSKTLKSCWMLSVSRLDAVEAVQHLVVQLVAGLHRIKPSSMKT